MDQSQIVAASKQVLLENYGRLPIAFVRGEDSFLFDGDGKQYLDLFVGFGAGGVAGHCHPKITQAIQTQAQTLLSHGNLYTNLPQVRAAELLIKHSFPGKVFFCHSGAEANEAALKLARRKGDPQRYKVISFENCFHGRTMGGLSLTPASFQERFGPMLPGNIRVPYGDLRAVEDAIDSETAAIFFEPIQGEGGMNVPAVEFVQGLRKLCDANDLLLVCDEVWTAPARTGKWFGFQHYGITPDVVTVAKSLGGGVPIAACIIAEKHTPLLGPGSHGCTMGGNPLCAAACAAALELIEEEQLDSRAEQLGKTVVAAIEAAKLSAVKSIRGKGLMIGLELDEKIPVREIMLKALGEGLLVGVAKHNVLRLAPALTVQETDLRRGVEHLLRLIAAGV